MESSTYLTKLEEAISENDRTTFSQLLQARPGKEVVDDDDLGPALGLAIETNQLEMVNMLLDRGAKPEVQDGHAALDHESSDALIALLKHGLDVNATDARGMTLLKYALFSPHHLKVLLDYGADPNVRDRTWKTSALDLSAGMFSVETLRVLLQHGADLKSANTLHSASASDEEGRVPIMAFLLDECELDVNALSTFGRRLTKRTGDEDGTPLQAAIKSGLMEHVQFLVDRGADPYVKSAGDEDAFEYARSHGFEDGLAALEEALKKQQAH